MSSIFHYTNTQGLLGILGSETLFATDYRFLNDSTEGQIIRELIMPILETDVAELTPKLIERKWLKKGFYDEHGVSGHRMQAERLYASVVRAVNNVSPFFVASFCRHEENSQTFEHGLLSQWRGYAESGGFAIEFDEQQLDALLNEEVKKFAYAGMKSDDVAYEDYESQFDPAAYKGSPGK